MRLTDEGAITLSKAIVRRACKEYRAILRRIKKHPELEAESMEKWELERFFRSRYFSAITMGLDGNTVIQKLRKEVEHG